MLSNNHVVKGCKRVLVKLNDDSIHIARILYESTNFDIALLKIENARIPQFAWFRASQDGHIGIAGEGDSVIYGGFDPKPISQIDVSNGKVVSVPDAFNPDKRFVSTMISGAAHGASGSGVFEKTEALVGLIFAGYIDVGTKSKQGSELDPFYGDNIVKFYNADALIQFLQHESPYRPQIYYRTNPPDATGLEVKGHAFLSSALVVCHRG